MIAFPMGQLEPDPIQRKAPEFRLDHRCVLCGSRLTAEEFRRKRPVLAADRCFTCLPPGTLVPELKIRRSR